MLSRLETMVLMGMDIPLSAIRQQIASAVDVIIHLGRLRDRSRKVLEICEITGIKNEHIELRTLYKFKETGNSPCVVEGRLFKVNDIQNTHKLSAAGLTL
jgi:pilus assembly protein CpaF